MNSFFKQFAGHDLSFILKRFAELFPFENLDVLNRYEQEITPEFLKEKLIDNQRGGLCYELNALLFLTLKELGFDVQLTTGTVKNEGVWAIDHTHATVLLKQDGHLHLVESGFGNRLPLSPLLLDGESVSSPAGTFRFRTVTTEKGTLAMEQLVNDEWIVRYGFSLEPVNWSELMKMKETIHHDERSTFTQAPVIAGITGGGTFSIARDRLRLKWPDGSEKIVEFEHDNDFSKELARYCSPSIVKEAELYLNTEFRDEKRNDSKEGDHK